MKILLINDFLECGGAEVHLRYEYEILKNNGHDVYILTFDTIANYNKYKSEFKNLFNIFINNKYKIIKIINKFFFNISLYIKIKKIINKIKPDIIHLHNINLSPLTQLLSVKKYKVIQTVHDYSIVCPKGNCIYNKNVCTGYRNNCLKCFKEDKTVIIKKIRLSILNNLKRKYISKFISPSKKLCEYVRWYGFDCEVINNPVKEIGVKYSEELLQKKFNDKIYLYFGQVNENKGIFEILDEMIKFINNNKNSKFYIVGNADDYYKEKLINRINGNDRIKYLGKLEHNEVLKLLRDVYCVIVPSLWMENYPTTVIEAIQNKCLVIGSNRGGIPEIIDNYNYIFDIFDKKKFSYILNDTYSSDFKEYLFVVEKMSNKIKINNQDESYYRNLKKIILN